MEVVTFELGLMNMKTVLTESARKASAVKPISLLYESLVIRKYLPTLQLVICTHMYFASITSTSLPAAGPVIQASLRPQLGHL